MTDSEPKSIVVEGELATPETVRFKSYSPILLKDVPECADEAKWLDAQGQLFLPAVERAGRPAVVIVQGLGGPKPERELTYGYKLAKAGFVALALDSFGARDLADADDKRKAFSVTTWAILADTFAGLRFLAAHPAVDPKAISVIGFSWGGMVTVLAAYEQIRSAYLGDDDLRFAGHVALLRLQHPAPGRSDDYGRAGAGHGRGA